MKIVSLVDVFIMCQIPFSRKNKKNKIPPVCRQLNLPIAWKVLNVFGPVGIRLQLFYICYSFCLPSSSSSISNDSKYIKIVYKLMFNDIDLMPNIIKLHLCDIFYCHWVFMRYGFNKGLETI